MNRSELSAQGRENLNVLVAGLFAGDCLAIELSDGSTRYLCYRMREEELPRIPLDVDPGEGMARGAMESALFASYDVFMRKAGESQSSPAERRLMGAGSLDEVLFTIKDMNLDVEPFLSAYRFQRSAGRALKSALGWRESDSMAFVEINARSMALPEVMVERERG